MKTVAISGYFNPLHRGHLNYIEEASKIGDKLIVIVNNDRQVEIKNSVPFQSEDERAEIISALKYVDEVMISIDEDATVCNSLAYLRPDIFAKGGDRTLDNIPEKEVCQELGIKMVFEVGGSKVQSSSKLIRDAMTPHD